MRPAPTPPGRVAMPGLWPRARAAWLAYCGTGAAASVAVGLLVLGCVFLSVAAPRESLALRTRALHDELARVNPLGRSLYGYLDYSAFEVAAHRVDGSAITAAQSRLHRNLLAAGLPLAPAGADWSGLSTGYQGVTGAAPSLYSPGATPPQLELLFRDQLPGYATLTAGRFPAAASSGRVGVVLQVAVTQATAVRYGLAVGSRVGIGAGLTAMVTGIVRPDDPSSGFWTADPAAKAPQLDEKNPNLPPYWNAAAFIGPAELGTVESELDIADMSVSWDYPLDLHGIQASQAVNVQDGLGRAVGQAGQLTAGIGYLDAGAAPVTLASGVSSVLDSFIEEDQAVGSVLSMLSVSLAAVAVAVVLLAAFLIAEHRNAELAVMRTRGASRSQVAGIVLRSGAVIAVPAALAGGLLAVRLTPGDSTSLAWWLAGGTIVVAVAGPAAVTAARHRRPGSGTGVAHLPEPGVRAVRRLITEVALTALAVGGLILLRQQGRPGGDLYAELAPVLVAVPAALLVMRCYPLVLRALIKLAGRLSGATVFVGLARAARTAPRVVLPTFALILALSAVGFGTMMRAAVARGEVTASWQHVGADAVVNATGSTVAVTAAALRSIGAVPGVEHVAAAVLTSGRTARGATLAVVSVNPRRFAALIADTPLPAFPAPKLTMPGGSAVARGPFPALVTAAAATALPPGPARLDLGIRQVTVNVTGVIAAVPWAPGRAVIVLPMNALGRTAAAPNVIVVSGQNLDSGRFESVARRSLPGAVITLRSAVLAEHAGAPLPNGAYRALAMASGAAAGLIALVVVIALVLGAPSREDTLARLAVMGLARRQARWLVVTEVLPQIVLAAIGGLGCAATLIPLLAPAIDLSSLTGSPASVTVSAQPVPLALAAAGTLAVAVVALAVQTAIAGRRADNGPPRLSE
ncbi:MAG TPA: FtsX-like permease family protein [Streptosporangiaceae bacterium]|nr:FtsX-like permease family protein [Streptosporangiaceae bacterium]